MKNEHIIWAYADLPDSKGKLLIIGLTNDGLDYLRAGEGKEKKTLTITPPMRVFLNVAQVVIYNEKDKATLKERLRESGVPVSEVN
jgi:hypothetical protein